MTVFGRSQSVTEDHWFSQNCAIQNHRPNPTIDCLHDRLPYLVTKVLCNSRATWLIAVGSVAVFLVSPEHYTRATDQIESIPSEGRIAVIPVQEDGLPVEALKSTASHFDTFSPLQSERS